MSLEEFGVEPDTRSRDDLGECEACGYARERLVMHGERTVCERCLRMDRKGTLDLEAELEEGDP